MFAPIIIVNHEAWQRTVCSNLGPDLKYYEKCPSGSEYISIYGEKIKIENVGWKQAKNAEISITTDDSIWVSNFDCPEGNQPDVGEYKFLKFNFKRFSQGIVCVIEFESLKEHAISNIVIAADDTHGSRLSREMLVTPDLSGIQALIIIALIFFGVTASILYLLFSLAKELILFIKLRGLNLPDRIRFWSCDFRFEEPEIDESQINFHTDAERKVIELRDKWIETARSLSKLTPKRESSERFGEEEILQLKDGEVRISIQGNSVQNRGKYFRSANLLIRTEKPKTIYVLLKKCGQPCWTFFREFHTEFDVQAAVNVIKKKTGRLPGSSGSTVVNQITTITDADYTVIRQEGHTIRVSLSRGNEQSGGRIGIIYDGEPNRGFFRIKGVLALRIIMLMLYGEISIKKGVEIVNKASTKQKFLRLLA